MTTLGLPDFESLSLEAQIAQLVVVRASGYLFDHQRRYPQWELDQTSLRHCVETLGIGGVILLGGSAVEVGVRSQQLQAWADIPLLLAADIEEGVGQRFTGATHFPPPMALSAIADRDLALACDYAQQMGAITAQEAIAIGLNWVLAPVVDVNNNADNPVINVRAFGDTPERVSQLSRAFIQGAQQFPILTTAKHFPGHGDTAVDSHLHLPEIPHDLARLEAVELAPFRAAIAQQVDAVMTAHLRVPTFDAQLPATLSPAILTGLLRRDLGFQGLIVTDALIMGAIAERYGPYEAAVMALEAGADVLLMPADPAGTIAAVAEAVRIGRLNPAVIQAAVARIWRAKQKVSHALTIPPETCHAWEHIPPPPVQLEQLATSTARQTLHNILTASMTVRGTVTDRLDSAPQSLVIVDDVLMADWLSPQAGAIAIPTAQGYCTRLVDGRSCPLAPLDFDSLPPTLLQIFSRGNPFRGRAGLSDFAAQCFTQLNAQNSLVGLVVYGSPYVLESLLAELPPTVPYGFTYSQTPEGQAVLLTQLFATKVRTVGDRTFTN
ncbi:glycoside hydrolase family 3 N-terminal domain-containing protein [Leptolyngbya iicbica]|uniref:beta-N-acetylhexosaminidase n=2 Tax=Cyanophyceae TaxID=3028117 RepID=A0A4Q7E502_9CYAN|nr:glycoside hydrolase family 3 N-terminal domain-containing protein [Leptolyngbya sp. LK]RZM77308.1 beta-glucosidase [Leptolyngbya sp. LK]